MDQGAADGDLHPLAGREALHATVDDLLHVQQVHQEVDGRRDRRGVEGVQLADVAQVLAGREADVEAVGIGQDADEPLHGERIRDHVGPVDGNGARVRREQAVERAQGRGLAGAVGAEQAGDAAVARREADPVHRHDIAEAALEAAHLHHGSVPAAESRNGGRRIRSRQLTSRSAWLPVSMNSATTSSAQPLAMTPWPAPGATT